MTTREPSEAAVEAAARAIARNHDLDPDDCRLGKPAWQIDWILVDARAALRAAYAVDATEGRDG
jgi:hypothetical protein